MFQTTVAETLPQDNQDAATAKVTLLEQQEDAMQKTEDGLEENGPPRLAFVKGGVTKSIVKDENPSHNATPPSSSFMHKLLKKEPQVMLMSATRKKRLSSGPLLRKITKTNRHLFLRKKKVRLGRQMAAMMVGHLGSPL